jgi:hypothetical protein
MGEVNRVRCPALLRRPLLYQRHNIARTHLPIQLSNSRFSFARNLFRKPVPTFRGYARALSPVFFAAPGTPSSSPPSRGQAFPPRKSEGMEHRAAHQSSVLPRSLSRTRAPLGAPWRLRASGFRQRHRLRVRVSWFPSRLLRFKAAAPVRLIGLSRRWPVRSSGGTVPVQRAPRGGVLVPPIGSRGLPGAGGTSVPARRRRIRLHHLDASRRRPH